jgi:hypothetical protein
MMPLFEPDPLKSAKPRSPAVIFLNGCGRHGAGAGFTSESELSFATHSLRGSSMGGIPRPRPWHFPPAKRVIYLPSPGPSPQPGFVRLQAGTQQTVMGRTVSPFSAKSFVSALPA